MRDGPPSLSYWRTQFDARRRKRLFAALQYQPVVRVSRAAPNAHPWIAVGQVDIHPLSYGRPFALSLGPVREQEFQRKCLRSGEEQKAARKMTLRFLWEFRGASSICAEAGESK